MGGVLFCRSEPGPETFRRRKGGKLIPGEDLRVYAEVSNSNGSVISEIKECNSIFQDITENKVLVSSIRHLENLDYRISGFKPEDSGEAIGLSPAEDGSNGYVVSQQEDLPGQISEQML